MVVLAQILRLVTENSSVGNFCFLFKHYSEVPTPVLNREVEKSGSHARVRYTGPLGQRFPAHGSSTREFSKKEIRELDQTAM